jgi:hypothetical protein
MIEQFAREVLKSIRKDMNNYADDMANGKCQDYAAYQKLCGVIRGLAIAEEHVSALAKNIEENDE